MAVSEQDTESLLPGREDDDNSVDRGRLREGESPCSSSSNSSSNSSSSSSQQQCRVSVEPAVLVTVFALGLDTVLHDQLLLQKICEVHFNFSAKVCSTLEDGRHPEKEEAVQQLASRYRMYTKVVEQILGLVMVVVMGVYSDALDRRLPLLWCHAGFLLMAVMSAVNTYYWWLPPEMLLLNYVMLGAGGGTLVLSMGVEAYVSAASEERHRTTRLGVLKVMAMVGSMLGPAVAIPVFHSSGYLAVYGMQGLAFTSSIVYMLLMLEKRPGESASQATQQQQQALMSLASLRSTALLVVFRGRRPSNRRRILAHMCIVWLRLFSLGSLSFLFFSARSRFHWSYKIFTLWSVIDVMVSLLGLLVAMLGIRYTYEARDGVLGLLGSFSLLFKNVFLATAPRAWVLYLGSAAGVCGELVGVASRGVISKVVEKRHLGVVFAMLAVGEGLVPVLSATVFAALFTATLSVFPGTVFVLSAFCCVLISCVFVWEVTLDSVGCEERAVADGSAEAPCPHLASPGSVGRGSL